MPLARKRDSGIGNNDFKSIWCTNHSTGQLNSDLKSWKWGSANCHYEGRLKIQFILNISQWCFRIIQSLSQLCCYLQKYILKLFWHKNRFSHCGIQHTSQQNGQQFYSEYSNETGPEKKKMNMAIMNKEFTPKTL